MKFRTVAINETKVWGELPEECTAVYGVYLIADGEATHCCSITPSSRADFIENQFCGIPHDHGYAEEFQFESGGADSVYFDYIDFANTKLIHSDAFEIDEDMDEEDEDKRREKAWNDAREHVSANPPYLAVPL